MQLADVAGSVRMHPNGVAGVLLASFLTVSMERLHMSDGIWGRVHLDLPGRRGTR